MSSRRSILAGREPFGRFALAIWLMAVAVVVTGSLLPPSILARLQNLPGSPLAANDKVIHFCAYTILAILPVVGFELISAGVFLAGSLIPLGVTLEFLQRLVPGRSFEKLDMVANTLGVFTGVLIAYWLRLAVRPNQPQTDS